MKIGTGLHSVSYYGSVAINSRSRANVAPTQSRIDSFNRSAAAFEEHSVTSDEMRSKLRAFTESIKGAERIEPLNLKTDEDRVKFNFDLIKMSETGVNNRISQGLEEAGVPKDVTFEFDFNFRSDITSSSIQVTNISDEKYRDTIENILSSCKGPLTFISCASRVMNGNISSIYYPWIESSLKRCFDQDINDLIIDENGRLGGVNKNLQAAFNAEYKAEKNGDYFDALTEFGFPVNNMKEVITRLVSDKNITPNISHMGYDGERIFTNDGEFKFGKDFDSDLFGQQKYLTRGTSALFMTIYGHTNTWLNNYEMFC